MAFSRRRYKNTVHKNPFREDRPFNKKPIIITAIATVALIAVIVGVVFLVKYCSITRLVKDSNEVLRDPTSGITYRFSDYCYTARIDTDEANIYAECDGVYYYRIKYGFSPNYQYVDPKIAIACLDEHSQTVKIYVSDKATLPTYQSITPENTIIMAVELIEKDVGVISKTDMANIIDYFKNDENVMTDSEKLLIDLKIDADSQRWLYISDTNCPGIYYIIRYTEDKDGGRYLYTYDRSRYVALKDNFKEVNFLGYYTGGSDAGN